MQKETNAIFEAAHEELRKEATISEEILEETALSLTKLRKNALQKQNNNQELKTADISIEYDED